MNASTIRPAHEHAIEHAIRYAGAFTDEPLSINVFRLQLQSERMRPICGHWALKWFDGPAPTPNVLFGYDDEGLRLGLALKTYLNQQFRLELLSDSRSSINPGRDFEMLAAMNGQPTLILMGVLDTPDEARWLVHQAVHSGADVLGVAAIASFDPAITAETLGVQRLTVGWQLNADWESIEKGS